MLSICSKHSQLRLPATYVKSSQVKPRLGIIDHEAVTEKMVPDRLQVLKRDVISGLLQINGSLRG